jgi:Protein of unknown function (DUF2892)
MASAAAVGSTDRLARIGAGVSLIALAQTDVIGASRRIGVAPLAAGFLRFRPACRLVGMNTCGVK